MPLKVLSSDDWFEIALVKQTTASISFQWTFRNPLDVPYDLFKVEKCYSVKRDQWEMVYWGTGTTLTVRCLEQNLCYSFRASILHQPTDGADFQYAYQSPIFKACTLPNVPSTMGLYRAVKKSQPGLVRRLLHARPELVNVPVHGETFLYLAVRSGNLDLVNVLLDGGANIDQGVPDTSVTPLHLAVYRRNLALVRHLIEKGANVQAQNCVGMTIGHYAIDTDDLAMVKYVLAQGISQEARDRCQWTLIFRAIYMRASIEIVRHLLERKCRLKVKDRLRLTPLYYAQMDGREGILRLLRRRLKI
ncbi:putative ankyrin repeat protein RF_0381 [Anopheles ziemanni]|uniref:putative ankyrin repeat protein RF_0381 n=1 Tax=Anopheles coustani TaxID=139045 RepID=UPI00265AE020|nr:putative ankyrin repeat protein RF_0381 [Anopheles coustani]XP_058173665.1 putative ankyrin repeat protein RF_0381 [Anopheles ziemanni]